MVFLKSTYKFQENYFGSTYQTKAYYTLLPSDIAQIIFLKFINQGVFHRREITQ